MQILSDYHWTICFTIIYGVSFSNIMIIFIITNENPYLDTCNFNILNKHFYYMVIYYANVVLQILENVNCPVLAVLTDIPNLAHVWRSAKLALKFIASKPNFQRIDVEGNHDVHLNSPETIAPLISRFLTTHKSSL